MLVQPGKHGNEESSRNLGTYCKESCFISVCTLCVCYVQSSSGVGDARLKEYHSSLALAGVYTLVAFDAAMCRG